MIAICPIFVKDGDSTVLVTAVRKDAELRFLGPSGNNLPEVNMVGFPTQEAKDLWYAAIVPNLKNRAFDPEI